MATIKINEQISFLRKQKGLTQEALAQKLGVSNQAISKWEAGTCCPDIQLLPEIAKIFGVSVDELMGYKPAIDNSDLILNIRQKIYEMPQKDADKYTAKLAAILHSVLFSKRMDEENNSGWNTEEAIKHAGEYEWGYSCINTADITTAMRDGAVFFSSNENLSTNHDSSALRISHILKAFSDIRAVKVANALYRLTYSEENNFVSVSDIAEASRLSVQAVDDCLMDSLLPFLCVHNENDAKLYRFEGRYMNLVPMISLFDVH